MNAPRPVTAFIGLGANLGDAVAALHAACTALEALPDTTLVACSRLYRSAPVGVTGQPDYVNAVAQVRTPLSAESLLTAMMRIEADHGRHRAYPMAPRTLDLDLLLYGDARIDRPHLHVPHPRMHLRAFVLVPLAELAPELEIPGAGRVADLLPAVADQAIEPLSELT
ncbi:2-amino-4-hydroxy-6-hydroxymethyldihydropteridine diphosphokinase [Nitrogeniibacter mangrovi]|uniref:2-amino-4-hydroxy-6-hydroxymethyldihydropteridine pyrophosphokinase n=1 Tax=Nitrogeniibacter mangrovi TaxID=2016596 RepID=A0A6C1B882_9RHOO|nr:2-amino-4-hydroxy-6-hydroxymethyldihydropteridine diphosphokinase [Nitrogeniibacter mangrovi]QID18454.1 2-amino-4-hydroxy-6-hydroxymethyldihydropteridine diphosphokinase [Nitrogeniibacter mangrovi]